MGEICELSDHCPVEISLKNTCPAEISQNLAQPVSEFNIPQTPEVELKSQYKKQYFVKNDSNLEGLAVATEAEEIDKFLDNVNEHLDDKDVSIDKIVEKLRTKMIDLSESNLDSKIIFSDKKSNFKHKRLAPWFDSECKEKKTVLNRVRKAYQAALKSSDGDILTTRIRELKLEYFEQRRCYKKIVKSKRQRFLENEKIKLWNLKGEDPKAFWKKLKNARRNTDANFSDTELFNYFNRLLNASNTIENQATLESSEVDESELSLDSETQKLIDDMLNNEISVDEVKQMIKRLKNGKASGLDMLGAELLKHLNKKFLRVFTKLFNKLMVSGKFPKEWSVGIIVVLFKGGDKTDLNNYRGITLLSIFGKLFLGILLHRLNNVISQYEILEENQIGFRKGYQTSDHIFTLGAIIEHSFENLKAPVYLCFIDFRKAFDSVDHKLLLQKLVTYGLSGNFLQIITSMYEQVKSCVRVKNGLTDIFPCNKGVRQGCLLSPIFFALFLNDLNKHIRMSSDGILLGDTSVHTLLYADDLVLIGKDAKDLQKQLDALDNFTKLLNMEVNLGKTKVMVLQKKIKKV